MAHFTDPVSYLGCPYNHNDKEVMRRRYRLVNYYLTHFHRLGKLVYSPLTHNIPMHTLGIEQTWDWWQTFDIAMLSRCNELIVLQLDGWERSVGLTAEIKFATQENISISYCEPDIEILNLLSESTAS
jgi:hypothetical protein